MSHRPITSRFAVTQSPSALAIHSRVSGFIDDPALPHGLLEKKVLLLEAAGDFHFGPDDQVHREARIQCLDDARGGPCAAPLMPQGNEEVHVGVNSRRAPGIRTEKNDARRLERQGQFLAEPLDLRSVCQATTSLPNGGPLFNAERLGRPFSFNKWRSLVTVRDTGQNEPQSGVPAIIGRWAAKASMK